MLQASRARPRCAICSVASSVEVTSTSLFVMLSLACHALMPLLMVDDTRHAATILIPRFQRTSSRTLCIGETLGSRIHAVPRNEINSDVAVITALIPTIRKMSPRSIVSWLFGILQPPASLILVEQSPLTVTCSIALIVRQEIPTMSSWPWMVPGQ